MNDDEMLRTAHALETPEAMALQARIETAEDDGDIDTALRLVLQLPLPHDTCWVAELAELVEAGLAATPWMWARYYCGRAYRWAIGEGDLRADRVVRNALSTMYLGETQALVDPVSGTLDNPDDLVLLGSRVIATDCLVEDAVLFDAGALADYLEKRAGRTVRRRAGRLLRWAKSRPSVYRLESVRDSRLVVTDLRTSKRLSVLHTGETVGHVREQLVLGRLVPTPAPGKRLFASRPVAVDEITGSELLESFRGEGDYLDRFVCIARAIESDRMLAMPGARVQRMGLASAMNAFPGAVLPPDRAGSADSCPGPRATELMASDDLARDDAEGVAVCELALTVAADEALSDALPALAHHAAIALSSPVVHQHARMHLTDRANAPLWLAMSRCLHGPDRERLTGLSAVADRLDASGLSAVADPTGPD